jgi:hypothetical protein
LGFYLVVALISVAFYYSLRFTNNKLKQLAGGHYFIDNSVLKFESLTGLTRAFKLEEIVVIHKKYAGAMVVKGNSWTKLNYIRPKRGNSYQLGGSNTIFIPTITTNYTDLIGKINHAAPNVMKLGRY